MSFEDMRRFTCDACGEESLVRRDSLLLPEKTKEILGRSEAHVPKGWFAIWGVVQNEWTELTATTRDKGAAVHVCSVSCVVKCLNEFAEECAATFNVITSNRK